MRTTDKADPDPELMTVALRVWPLMLIVTINNLVFLTYIAGISGGYVFIVIFVNFLTTYAVLWKTLKVPQKKDSRERKDQVPEEEIPRLAIENEKDAPSEEKEESKNAAIEMSILAADTGKDIEEEQEAEEKREDNKEADEAQTLPPTETPGLPAGTSEDAEECQTEAKTEGKEEADGAQTPTETPGLPAGTSDDAEETEDKEEADRAQMPPPAPSSEMPGTGTSKDIESQKEEEQTGAVLETAEKGEEESFLFAASVCSTWIPSVVGDPEQRFFLKAGEPLQCTGLSFVS